MELDDEVRAELLKLLRCRLSLEDLRDLCYLVRVGYHDLPGEQLGAKLRELIAWMELRDRLGLLFHALVQMRDDLGPDLARLGLFADRDAVDGDLLYLDIATTAMLPPAGIMDVLRDPQRSYLDLTCAETPGTTAGTDALEYIESLFAAGSQVIVIFGDYGTGKSFLAQRLFLDTAKAYRAKAEGARLPVLQPLKRTPGPGGRIVIGEIAKELRALRFFSGQSAPEDEPAELDRRMREGELLCILDGFDEIPLQAVRKDSLADLVALADMLAAGRNRVLITTRSAILPGGWAQIPADREPTVGVGYLRPWLPERDWPRYLSMCAANGVDFGADLARFRDWVLSRPALRQLTATPLYCQMLVDTRNEIAGRSELSIADLYGVYTSQYFSGVSERGLVHARLSELRAEISYKHDCLAATAVGMLKRGSIWSTRDEIWRSLSIDAQQYDDDLLSEFVKLDTLIYSLLVPGPEDRFSFSHKSFYEYYIAVRAARELDDLGDPENICSRSLLPKEVLSFLADIVRPCEELQRKLARAFALPAPLRELGVPVRRPVLLRNLALLRLEEHPHRIENANLDAVDFSGYRFAGNGSPVQLRAVRLGGSEMEGADLTGAVLEGSHLAGAKLNRCTLDHANLRGTNLTGAHLHGVSCTGTLFAGATFTGVSLGHGDASRIIAALYDEQARNEDRGERDLITDDWLGKTIGVLKSNVVPGNGR